MSYGALQAQHQQADGFSCRRAWAKEAWRHYWFWDSKETWAVIAGAVYLVYIHMRLRGVHRKFTLWTLPIAFILPMIKWLGFFYLPSLKAASMLICEEL